MSQTTSKSGSLLRSVETAGTLSIAVLLLGPACRFESLCDNPNPSAPVAGSAGKPSTAGGGRGGSEPAAGTSGKGSKGGSSAASGGTGGEAGAGPSCDACPSGMCRDDGSCIIDCSVADVVCPNGQYCSEDQTCASGCDDATRCASGICDEDHSCRTCINDDECRPGYRCSGGECAVACSAAQEGDSAGCRDDLTCCSLACRDSQSDSQNCGACGNSCGAGQFCAVGECHDTTLESLCSIPKLVVILGTSASDDDSVSGRALGSALAATCTPAPTLEEANQADAAALNVTTGRPLSDGTQLLIVVGGASVQNAEGNLEARRVSHVYARANGDYQEYRDSATDDVVVSQAVAGDHDSQDLFVIQFVRDPDSGSLLLNAQGFWPSGTAAATYQFVNGMLPQLSQYRKAWYVYQWTDANADQAPDSNEIALVASGG